MNRKSDKDRLLRDIFGAPDHLEFRERLHRRSLVELRKRKIRRRFLKIVVLAAAVLGPAILGFLFLEKSSEGIEIVYSKTWSEGVVREPVSAASSPVEILHTQECPARKPNESLTLEVVRTRRETPIPILTDEELLDTFPHEECLLAQGQDGSKKFLVFDPERESWQREFGHDSLPPN